jgi:CTP synthase
MRLGAYPCTLKEGSVAAKIYGAREISERHRHRFEFNNAFRDEIQGKGLVLSGLSPDERLVEMVELTEHRHFVGCQFHPEFKSRPHAPHPLFTSFVRAAREQRDARGTRESKVEVKDASETTQSSRAVH